jgi:hypothetical protein
MNIAFGIIRCRSWTVLPADMAALLYVTSATDNVDTLNSAKYCAERFAIIQYSNKEKRFRNPKHTIIADSAGSTHSLQQ